MTYQEALSKKMDGDWLSVAQICGITADYARNIALRPNSKKYKSVMDALVAIVECRENVINQQTQPSMKTKDQRIEFLSKGGVLLRSGTNKKGQAIIKKKTFKQDWHIHMICPSPEKAIEIIQKLIEKKPGKYAKDQD